MEAKQFAELLKSPLLVEQLPTETLRELASRYPFSPSLQMLLLKQYQLKEHPAYDEQLAKTAIYAPDRRALYRLVQLREAEKVVENEPEPYIYESEETPTFVAESTDIADTIEVLETVADAETITPEPAAVESPLPDTTAYEIPQEEALPAFGLVPPPIPLEHLIVAAAQEEPENEEPEETTVEPEAEPDLQTLSEPDPETPETTQAESIAPIDINDEVAEPDTATVAHIALEHDVQPEANTEQEPIYHNVPDTTVVEPEVSVKDALAGKDSFTGWLKRLKKDNVGHFTDKTPTTAETVQPTETDVDEKAALDALFGEGTYEATLIKASIDLAPADTPKTPTKEDLLEPDPEANKRMDEQAKKSLSMGEELVTETLAKIYEIQKKYPKAIEAYGILKLRYPEKAEQYDKKIQALREI